MAKSNLEKQECLMSEEALKRIDEFVGTQLKLRRTFLGISQERLGIMMDLTFQQVQKYEKGLNRISASRLYEISKILNVPISYFFDGLQKNLKPKSIPYNRGLAEEKSSFDSDPLKKKESIDLLRAYYNIKSPVLAKKIFDLIKTVSSLQDGENDTQNK